MAETNLNLGRRKFMLMSSAAIATPLLLNWANPVSDAKGAETKGAAGGKIYYINRTCIGCYCCKLFCPADAVILGDCQLEIDQERCIHCGTCYKECPICAISETEL